MVVDLYKKVTYFTGKQNKGIINKFVICTIFRLGTSCQISPKS
jgi:hypothetical protein